MARYQYPNPLDLLFFAGELATRRAGLPGVYVHLNLVLRGQVDTEGLRRAVRALCRLYPTLAAARDLDLLTGRPRWRLDTPLSDVDQIVRLHRVEPGSSERVWGAIEELFNRPLDRWGTPLRVHVFRGLAEGDVVVLRWPHALMDGRGGFLVVEELARLYAEARDPAELTSAGDEQRSDYRRLIGDGSLLLRLRMLRDMSHRARPGHVLQLVQATGPTDVGRMYVLPRSLSVDQTARVLMNMRQFAGASPSADYVRACALHALDTLVPGPRSADAVYTTMALVDNRRHGAPAVCWNLNTALPIVVPAGVVGNVPALTKLIRGQMIAHVRSRSVQRYWATLSWVTRMPTAYLAAVLRSRLLGRRASRRGFLLAPAPSLRLDFIGPFMRPVTNFCGAALENYYGYGTLLPTPGFALHVNLTHDRLNVTGVGFDGRVPRATLATLLDRFLATLLEPGRS